MYDILLLIEEIDRVAVGVTRGGKGVFGKLSLRMPKFAPAELGFLRTVSWFYVLYYEVGRVNVEFLAELLPNYGLDPNGRLSSHLTRCAQLRTFLQHNLDPSKTRNLAIQVACEGWLEYCCGTQVPELDKEWERCLVSLLEENREFLLGLRDCIRCIEKDEGRDSIVEQWLFRVDRYHAPHEFDDLIFQVASDMGRDFINPELVRGKFYDTWVKELKLLKGNYDFKVEGRRLIEHVLLDKLVPVLPITGVEIMTRFEIPPGPKVGELLEEARRLYGIERCSGKELLDRLEKSYRASE